MTHFEIILAGLSLAFCWVEIIQPELLQMCMFFNYERTVNILGNKPFNCMVCCTGWFSLIIGLIVCGWSGLVFLPVGVFAGAIFGAVKMRWL